MMKIALYDDSKEWLAEATRIIEEYAKSVGIDASISTYESDESLIEDITDFNPDVLLMDVEFISHESGKPYPTGIITAEKINHIQPNCLIVFLTNNVEYALDVYQTEHVWYALKKEFADRLPEIADKVHKIIDERKMMIHLKTTSGSIVSISARSIWYVERQMRVSVVHTDRGDYEVRDKVSELAEYLPITCFGRCHNSIIVNMDKIAEISNGHLTLTDGTELSISRGYGKMFMMHYLDWVEQSQSRPI